MWTWWKNRSKWLRRSIVAISILVPVGFAAFLAYVYYDCEYGVARTNLKLSSDVYIHEFADYTERVYNKSKCYTTPKIDWHVADENGGELAVYAQDGKRGYFNIYTGDIVVDATAHNYTKAWLFSEGLAAVVKDGKIGFINGDGDIVIPFKYDYKHNDAYWDDGYLFHNGNCAVPNSDGYVGLIDTSGNWVVEPEYDEIWKPDSCGYRVVVKDGRYGVLSSTSDIVYTAEYYHITIEPDGFVFTSGGRMWKVDFDGNVVIPFMFCYTNYLEYPAYVKDGHTQFELSDYVMYQIGGRRYGIMNRFTGEPITLAIYSDINMISKDLFEVQETDSYDWYVIDTDGNIVLRE